MWRIVESARNAGHFHGDAHFLNNHGNAKVRDGDRKRRNVPERVVTHEDAWTCEQLSARRLECGANAAPTWGGDQNRNPLRSWGWDVMQHWAWEVWQGQAGIGTFCERLRRLHFGARIRGWVVSAKRCGSAICWPHPALCAAAVPAAGTVGAARPDRPDTYHLPSSTGLIHIASGISGQAH